MRIKREIVLLAALLALLGGCPASSPPAEETEQEEVAAILRLFYFFSATPVGDPASDPNAHLILSATSADGINFTEEEGSRFERVHITDPDVFQVTDSEFVMFSSEGTRIIKATASSVNGTYTEDSSFDWNNGAICSTVRINGTLRTFYCGGGGISVATYNPDTGNLEGGAVALQNVHGSGIICDPTVIQLGDGSYLMYYKWSPEGNVGPSQHKVYSATSTDGTTFTATNTLIRDQISVPGAVRIGGKIYLYFVDGSMELSDTGSVAVGISEDEGQTFSFQGVMIDGSPAAGAVDPNAVAISE